jgi:ribosomal protein S18 acetylase RimI-like enzyme
MVAAVIIRKAELADVDTLLEFEQAVIEAERPFDPTIKRSPTNYYDIRGLIESPDVELVVAELFGNLIGSGYARIEKSKPYFEHSHHSYLGFMYVVPEHRGRGVNKLIIDALYNWTRERGVQEVRLEVFSDNAAAIRAYEKAGFGPVLLTMRARLD